MIIQGNRSASLQYAVSAPVTLSNSYLSVIVEADPGFFKGRAWMVPWGCWINGACFQNVSILKLEPSSESLKL